MQAEYVQEWFVVADRDIAAAEYLATMHPQPYEIICYHCQQAVEKYLKAFLLSNDINLPTHMIWSSYATCVKAMNLLFRNTGIVFCSNTICSQSRYPSEIEVHERHMLKHFLMHNK